MNVVPLIVSTSNVQLYCNVILVWYSNTSLLFPARKRLTNASLLLNPPPQRPGWMFHDDSEATLWWRFFFLNSNSKKTS